MSITVVDRNYSTRNHSGGNDFLLANSGQIVTDSVDIVCEFDFQTTMNEQVLIVSLNKLRLVNGLWSKKGFVVGDLLRFYGTVYASTPNTTYAGDAMNIIDITGDTMTLSGNFDPLATNEVVGQLMPSNLGTLSNTPMGIMNTSRDEPETFEIFHNLILNTSNTGTGSLFDGEVNKFRFDGIDALSVSGTVTGVQQGNKSGGSYTFYEIERLADVTATDWTFTSMVNKSYRITLKYANPLKFEDSDFNTPSWFLNGSTLKPFYRFNAQSQANNPNSALTSDYAGQLGNVGWRDENYSQGVNEFEVTTVITDAALNQLAQIDYAQVNIVTATITHPSQDFLEAAEVEFFLIPDLNLVKNKPDRNCDLIQLSNFFINATPTITNQVFGTGGAEMVISAQTLDVSTANTIIVQFTLTPNAEFTALVESFSSLSRRYVITANVESDSGTSNDNNAVSLTLKQGILELSPVVGSPYPVREQSFYNHANPITGVPSGTYYGCAEDDFIYKALFNFNEGDIWNAIRLKIQVVRNSDSQAFDLVSKPVNLTNYIITPNGQIQINYNEPISQFLEAPERNQLKINLTGNAAAGEYEVQIIWSLMASWRYWIAQSNAFVDFFDNTLPNNGMNAEWMRYLREAGYSLRVRVELVDVNNTAFYFGAGIELQDYDDSDITTEFEYYNSSGVQQQGWVFNDIMTLKAIHTLGSGSWSTTDLWGWISVRPFENETTKRISTVWDWTPQSYPLLPPDGETKATISFPTPDVAVVECRVNTTMISTEDNTPVARIESPSDPVCTSPVDYLFNLVVASSDTEIGYIEALETYLVNGIIAKNFCPPTCSMLNNDTGLNDKVYGFKKSILTPMPSSPYFGNSPCCMDSYGTSGGGLLPPNCQLTFDTEWNNFMATLTGQPTAALTALVPGQINSYSGASLTLFIAKIQSITSDLFVQYSLMSVLVNRGIQIVEAADGTQTISGFSL